MGGGKNVLLSAYSRPVIFGRGLWTAHIEDRDVGVDVDVDVNVDLV